MYDTLSSDYDRFVSWPGRLEYEIPFIQRMLPPTARVLDAACGTGIHAIELARRGYSASGADLSAPMIERARANAAAAGQNLDLKAVGFGGLAKAFGANFDAVLCLGNSIPHLLTRADLRAALQDFCACLRPGGVLLLQNRNFDALLQQRARWMEPQAHREGQAEWIFLRFYDYLPDDVIQFNILTLRRENGDMPWRQAAQNTLLYPWRQAELVEELQTAGFNAVTSFGDMQGAAFDAASSGNLVITATR